MIRIITYNIAGHQVSAQLISALESLNADIIMLQEVEEYLPNWTTKTASKFGFQAIYVPSRKTKLGTHGLAILSRGAITEMETQILSLKELGFHSRERIAVHASTMVRSQTIKVCNVHLDTRLNMTERVEQLSAVLDKLKAPVIRGGRF